MSEAQILVARQAGVVQIRVCGRATFKISRDLREFGTKVLEDGSDAIIVDLSDCQGMDSTFIGVLAMIGLEGRGGTELVVVNASDAHRKLLDSIGVSKIIRFARERVPEVTWQNLCEGAASAVDIESVGPVVLAAHEALVNLDPRNVPKFKDVVELLTTEMGIGGEKERGE